MRLTYHTYKSYNHTLIIYFIGIISFETRLQYESIAQYKANVIVAKNLNDDGHSMSNSNLMNNVQMYVHSKIYHILLYIVFIVVPYNIGTVVFNSYDV